MRITDVLADKAVHMVELRLTGEEARELRDVLDLLLREDDPTRHEHVSSADYQTDVAVLVAEEVTPI